MSAVHKKMDNLRKMAAGKIPKEYQDDSSGKKYKSAHEKYMAICAELEKCTDDEFDNIEVLLKTGVEERENIKSFSGIISIFISSAALLITAVTPYLTGLIEKEDRVSVAENLMKVCLEVGVVGLISILLFWVLHKLADAFFGRYFYLLEVLKKVREKKSKRNYNGTEPCVKKTILKYLDRIKQGIRRNN